MKIAIFLIPIWLIPIGAWAQLQAPRLGIMVDREGGARPVFGVASSVTAGDAMESPVLSSACSSQLCLFKTRSSIVWAGGETKAPAGGAVFALNGTSAYVYFPRSRQLAWWQSGTVTMLDLQVPGEILSLRALADGSLQFAALKNGAVSIVDANDNVFGSIPGLGPVMLIAGGAVYATSDSVILRRGDASELRWALAGIQGFSAMGDGYVQIRAAGASYALRIDAGKEQLFMLPETGR